MSARIRTESLKVLREQGGWLHGMHRLVSTCPNCGTPADDSFCPSCGQRQGSEVLSVRYWISQLVESYLSLDGRVPRSIVALLFRPGFLTREWLAGRRVRFSSPLHLCLWAAIAFVAASLVGTRGPIPAGWAEGAGPLIQRALPLGFLAAVPAVAWVMHLTDRSRDLSYVEHLVFIAHLQAFYFVAFTPMVLTLGLDSGSDPWAAILSSLLGTGAIVYTWIATGRVYGGGWARTLRKCLTLGAGYSVAGPIATALVSVVIAGLAVGITALISTLLT